MTHQRKTTNEKGRYWAGLIYPGDSCPDDWEDRMKISGLEILVSPVHDQDIADIATGELKKPHRHVIAMWANTTTRQNAEWAKSDPATGEPPRNGSVPDPHG